MPWPAEYQRASDNFYTFLVDAKNELDVGSTHMAYTTVQGVFQCFRRRIAVRDAINFANVLPVGMRALFVADWDPDQQLVPFEDIETMTAEVRSLRAEHNFSPVHSIPAVALSVKRHVDSDRLEKVLKQLPPAAEEFWV